MVSAARQGIRHHRVVLPPGVWTPTYTNNPARFTVAGQTITDTAFAADYTVTSYGARGSGSIVLIGSTSSGASNPDGWAVLYEDSSYGSFQANTISPRTFSMAPNGSGSRGKGLVGYFGASFVGSPSNQPTYILPA